MVLQDSIVVSLVGGIIIGREQRGVGGMLVMLHFLMEVLLIQYALCKFIQMYIYDMCTFLYECYTSVKISLKMSPSASENDSLNQLTLLSVISINSGQNISIKSCLKIPENKQIQADIGDTSFEIRNAHILTIISSDGHPSLVHHR